MKTKEYRIYSVDKYDNQWFEMSFSGNPEIQKMNADIWISNEKAKDPLARFNIEEVG